jgi:hypothetical protein
LTCFQVIPLLDGGTGSNRVVEGSAGACTWRL